MMPEDSNQPEESAVAKSDNAGAIVIGGACVLLLTILFLAANDDKEVSKSVVEKTPVEKSEPAVTPEQRDARLAFVMMHQFAGNAFQGVDYYLAKKELERRAATFGSTAEQLIGLADSDDEEAKARFRATSGLDDPQVAKDMFDLISITAAIMGEIDSGSMGSSSMSEREAKAYTIAIKLAMKLGINDDFPTALGDFSQ